MKNDFMLFIYSTKFFSNVAILANKISSLTVNQTSVKVCVKGNDWMASKLMEEGFQMETFDEGSAHAFIIINNQHDSEKKNVDKVLTSGKPFRLMTFKLATLSNKKRNEHYDVYIGRGSIFGNPYSVEEVGSRDESIRMHSYDFNRGFLNKHEQVIDELNGMQGCSLGCYCFPMSCHGEVYVRYINRNSDIQINNNQAVSRQKGNCRL